MPGRVVFFYHKLFFLIFIISLLIFMGCNDDITNFQDLEWGLDQAPVNTTCLAPERPDTGFGIRMPRVFPGISFTRPVLMLQAPHRNDLWYIVEQEGKILVFNTQNPEGSLKTFADIKKRVTYGGERGLLSMAFHPGYPGDNRVFLSYTGTQKGQLTSFISSFEADGDGLSLKTASEKKLLSQAQPYANHNGGHMGFGKDGYLYIAFGDGGAAGDPLDNSQDPSTWLGKMLRIDIDNGSPYTIPPDNPFIDGGALPEIYALGLRNPWRWSFDRETGELWAGDVGQRDWEEIDLIKAGGNYGWNFKEGRHCYKIDPCDVPGIIVSTVLTLGVIPVLYYMYLRTVGPEKVVEID